MKKISILLFLGLFMISGCKKDEVEKDEEEEEIVDPIPTEPKSYFMTYTIDGETKTIENNVDGFGAGTTLGGAASPNTGTQSVETEARIEKFNSSFTALELSCGIGFGTYVYQLSNYNTNGKDELEQILAVKSNDFKTNTTAGAFVSFYEDNEFWTSDNVVQPSTASIIITETEPGTAADGSHFRTVKGTFSDMKMQNENGTAFKTITDGKFHLRFLPR